MASGAKKTQEIVSQVKDTLVAFTRSSKTTIIILGAICGALGATLVIAGSYLALQRLRHNMFRDGVQEALRAADEQLARIEAGAPEDNGQDQPALEYQP